MSINFSVRWADNTSELRAHLAEGLNQIEATRASVDKLARSLGGENVIRSANTLAAALQKVGGEAGVLAGVEKLTFQELERANATLDRAVQKYLALGQAIPQPIAALHQLIKAEVDAGHAADQATKGTDSFSFSLTSVNGLLRTFGVGLSVGAFIAFSKSILEGASALTDLSAKTGLTTEALQRLDYVGGQSGVTIDQFADAAFKLGAKLSGGGSSVRQAVRDLGLSFEALKQQSPEQQFDAIARALSEMESPQERNRLGIELFGKSFAAIAPAIVKGYGQMADAATVAGDAQVQAADRAGDRWDAFVKNQKARIASLLGDLVLLTEETNKLSRSDFWTTVLGAATSPAGLGTGGPISAIVAAFQILTEARGKQEAAAKKEAETQRGTTAEMVSYAEQLRKATAEVGSLTGAQRAEIVAGDKVGATVSELADRFGVSELAIRLFNKEISQTPKKAKDVELAFVGPIEALKSWGHQLDLIQGKASQWELKTLDMVEAAKLLGTALPKPEVEALLATNFDGVMLLWTKRLRDVETGFADLGESITKMGRQIKPTMNDIGQGLTKSKENFKSLSTILGELSNDFAQLGQISGGALGDMFVLAGIATKGIEQIVRASNDLSKMFDKAADSADDLGDAAKSSTSKTASMIASYGSLVLGIFNTVYSVGKASEEADQKESILDAHLRATRDVIKDFGNYRNFTDALIASVEDLAHSVETSNIAQYFATDLPAGVRRGAAAVDEFRRHLAEALNLSDFITQLGGLDQIIGDSLKRTRDLTNVPADVAIPKEDPTKNYAVIQARILDLFKVIPAGGKLASDAIKSIDDSLSAIGESTSRNGGLVDQFFLDMIAKAKAAGIELKNVSAFIQGQAANAETGIGGALKVTNDAYAKRADLIKQIADEKDVAKLADLNAQLKTQDQIIAATGIHSQAAAEAVSGSLLAIINSQVEAGKSYGDAIREVAPAMQSLQKQLEATGLTGGAAFDALNAQVALFTDDVAGPALASVEGYAKGLVGLNNAGLLNQDTFAGISEQIGATRDALVAQGKDGGQVLMAMRGPLQTLWELEQKFGYTTDASTQALIDQAKEQGLVGDKFKPVGEQMLDATNRIADAVEGLARVFGVVLPNAAKDGADAIKDEFGNIKIPPVRIPIDFPIRASDSGPYIPPWILDNGEFKPNPNYTPPTQPNYVPQFANGSYGLRDFGLGTPAILHGREAVVTEADMMGAREWRPGGRAAGNGRYTVDDLAQLITDRPILVQTTVELDGKVIAVAVAEQAVKGHMRDAILSGLGLV